MVDWADHTEIEQRLRGEVDAARAEYEAVGTPGRLCSPSKALKM